MNFTIRFTSSEHPVRITSIALAQQAGGSEITTCLLTHRLNSLIVAFLLLICPIGASQGATGNKWENQSDLAAVEADLQKDGFARIIVRATAPPNLGP